MRGHGRPIEGTFRSAMSTSVDEKTDNFKTQNAQEGTQKVEPCGLLRPLGDCPARRAGCDSHLAMLKFMHPPLSVLSHVRETMGSDPTVKQWLANVDAVLPGQRPTRQGWR